MAIASNITSGPYTGTGSQTVFPFTFTAVSASDVQVLVNDAVLASTLYTVRLNSDGTGSVTFSVAPASGAVVLIALSPDFAQETIYENEGAYKLDTVNKTNRRDAVRANWLARVFGQLFPSTFLSTTARANKFLAWDVLGNPYYSNGTGNDAAFRTDAGGSNGYKLVGRGTASLEQAIPPDSYIVSQPTDGSIVAGTGTSGAAALQALADLNVPQVRLMGLWNPAFNTTGSTILGDTVTIPTAQRWEGAGRRTSFVIPVADPKPNGYILLGTNTSYQSAQTYDLWSKSFGGAFFDGRAAVANGKSPVAIVVGGPGWRVHDIYAFSMQTVVRGADTGGSGGVDPHADHLRISNVHLNNQPNPVDFDPANPGNARYGIDWLRTDAGADTAEIERCQSNVMGALNSGTAKRCRFIGLRGFTSAKVRGIINGDVYFYQSNGVVEDCYFEHGVVSNMQSDMVVRSCHFWMRSEVTCGTDVGAVPLQFLATPSGVAGASQVPSSLSLRDCAWNYDAVGSGSAPGTVIGLGGYTLTNPNFSIGTNVFGTMTVENCWRAAPYSNGRGWYQRLGITCGRADFDNYSHFASVSSRFTGSAAGGDRWHIEAKRGATLLTSATTANGLESASFDTGFKGSFKAATATYYYRVAILQDKIRRIGILGGLEVSQAATNGATGAISLRLGFDIPGGGFIARVYRGTTSGSYDRYVDVPVIEAGWLYDSGVDIGGYPWITRTAGAADAVNAGLSGGLELGPRERTAASDAYGHCIAWSLTGAMPTVGGWRRGDEVGYSGGCWQRLTNCTSAAPAHVAGTDWKQILYPAAAAVTAPTGGATIDTQARTAINDLIARLQTQGIIS